MKDAASALHQPPLKGENDEAAPVGPEELRVGAFLPAGVNERRARGSAEPRHAARCSPRGSKRRGIGMGSQ